MGQRQLIGGGVGLLGVFLAVVQTVHAFRQTDIPIAIGIDAIPFAVMGLGLAYAGYGVASEPAFEETAPRIGAWGVGGTVVFAAVAAVVLFGQQVTTGTLARATYLTVDLVTAGALASVLTGIYDARSRNRLRELEDERDRTEAFARKAADVNNYGRVIHEADRVEDVAGYVVEAFEMVVGVHETAVCRVRGEEVELVESTVRSVDRDAVADLATESLDRKPGAVVVSTESPPGGGEMTGGEEVTGVLTVLVGAGEDAKTVVVAVRTDEEPLRDEDRKLLELLASHASVSIRGIADDTRSSSLA
jgi:hypothetical protein